MTEAEALDEAAKAAGWDDFADFTTYYHVDDLKSIRAHAKTLMENAALEAKLADVSKALMATAEAAASSAKKAMETEAKLAVAREALGAALTAIQFVRERDGLMDDEAALEKQARAALKEIGHGDR